MTDETNETNETDTMTAENLLERLRAMQTGLKFGEGFFVNFQENMAEKLSEQERNEAGALLRGTLFLCTALYDYLEGPALLGFGAGKETLYLNLLAAIDPSKLSAHVIDALFDDVQRLIECPGDVPRVLMQMFNSRMAEKDAAWAELEDEERRTRSKRKGK